METIINLLKDKNFHLQKFHQMNEIELMNFSEGNFDNLEIFYQSRETILDLVRCIDKLIEAAADGQDQAEVTDQHRQEMIRAMSQKDDLVQRILAQDLQVLSLIEQAKSQIIRELRSVSTAKKAIGGYKTGEVINKLDEKA